MLQELQDFLLGKSLKTNFTFPCSMYWSRSNGSVWTWKRAQNGHWKSENSIIVIGASGFPITGSSSAEIFTGSDGWFVGNLFCNILSSNLAIASSRSSCEIWFEFMFEKYIPAKNAATPTATINPIIRPFDFDLFWENSFCLTSLSSKLM